MIRRREALSRSVEEVYANPSVVEEYLPGRGLFPPELELFERYVPQESDVLDIGMGAGRTTAYLSPRARNYIGIDISPEMVSAAQTHFPGVDLRCGDATDLSGFADASFDVVVFSFNGIDHIENDALRRSCLAQCRRVLRPSGHLILSRHNPRSLLIPRRMRANANWKGKLVLAVRAVVATATLCCRRLIRPAFWQGHGYELDRTHGGMRLGVATPKMASRELAELGFEVIDGPLARNHPAKFVLYATGWYYLAALARS